MVGGKRKMAMDDGIKHNEAKSAKQKTDATTDGHR
jgi:hypothetical protein